MMLPHTSYPRLGTALVALLVFSPAASSQTALRSLVGGCADGDMNLCQQIGEVSTEDDEDAPGSLEALASAFRRRAPGLGLESNEEPPLEAGYSAVVKDYFESPLVTAEDRERYFLEAELPDCSAHYADVWLHERQWWPTNPKGEAEWKVLYLHVLDHYFGYCLTHAAAGSSGSLRPRLTRLAEPPPEPATTP
jgi:hypothetical protein